MKQVIVCAAALVVALGLAGCSCHRTPPCSTPVQDNTAYQSDMGSTGKLGHMKCKKHKHMHKHKKHSCDNKAGKG